MVTEYLTPGLQLPPGAVDEVFPFHFVFGPDWRIRACGRSLARICPQVVPGGRFTDLFSPVRPEAAFNFETLASSRHVLFLIRENATGVLLRGQLLPLQPTDDAVVFLGSPWVTEAPLSSYGLSFDDFAIHDAAMDLLQLLQAQKMAAADLQKLAARLQVQRAALHEANEKLRCEEAEHRRLAALVESAEDGIYSANLDDRITTWNAGAARLYGYTAEEIIGQPVHRLMPADREGEHGSTMARLLRGEHVQNLETRRRRKDGSEFEIALTVSPILDETGGIIGISTIGHDITRRRQLERDVAQASQHEQQRIARELHDHLGAYLAGLAFRVKTLGEQLGRRGAPEAAQALELVKLTNEASTQVRMFSHLLAPVEIATGGLAAALPRLGAEIERLFGVTCDVHVGSPLPALAEEHSMHLYRIAQEASRNAVEHGHARHVSIRLAVTPAPDGALMLTIRNDGKPWGPEPGSGRGLGLRIMRYRAGVLGGALSLQAGPDDQPEVACRIPLPTPHLQTSTP